MEESEREIHEKNEPAAYKTERKRGTLKREESFSQVVGGGARKRETVKRSNGSNYDIYGHYIS